jgi:ADP-heptose:LPS heptosyltransferase
VVVRANGLGDFVFALPALAALAAHHPGARITLLGRDWHPELLEGRPGPWDEVLVVPPTAPLFTGDPADAERPEVRRLLRAVRERDPDLAVQLHGGGRTSNPFTRLLGATTAVGACTPDAEPLDRTVRYSYFQHEVHRLLEVVALTRARPVTAVPRLAVTDADLLAAAGAGIDPGRRYAVLAPSAGDRRRRWPPERFAAVGDRLAADGLGVVVVGGPDDAEVCRGVARHLSGPCMVRCGTLPLGALVGVLAGAAVVVGNDSGPLHLAAAVGTPTVGIYWGPNLVNAGPIAVDRHRGLASWRLTCPCCGRENLDERCPHDVSFVADVAVDAVVAEALDVLARDPVGALD